MSDADHVVEIKRCGRRESPPTVSVVTVNLDGKDMLYDFLDSLVSGSFRDFELILVDNGSTDGSFESLSCDGLLRGMNALLIKLDKNLGFGRANNIGVAYARGKYVVFLNNDTTVDRDCLSRIIEPLKDERIGSVQARLLSSDGSLIDGEGDFTDMFGFPFVYAHGERAASATELFRAR